MNLLPVALGGALGLGALLCWQGFRAMTNRALDDGERRRGLWRMNAGLALTAASMIGFTYLG